MAIACKDCKCYDCKEDAKGKCTNCDDCKGGEKFTEECEKHTSLK